MIKANIIDVEHLLDTLDTYEKELSLLIPSSGFKLTVKEEKEFNKRFNAKVLQLWIKEQDKTIDIAKLHSHYNNSVFIIDEILFKEFIDIINKFLNTEYERQSKIKEEQYSKYKYVFGEVPF